MRRDGSVLMILASLHNIFILGKVFVISFVILSAPFVRKVVLSVFSVLCCPFIIGIIHLIAWYITVFLTNLFYFLVNVTHIRWHFRRTLLILYVIENSISLSSLVLSQLHSRDVKWRHSFDSAKALVIFGLFW